MKKNDPITKDDNELSALESVDMLAAYVYQYGGGEEGLRQALLADDLTSELLTDAAEELEARGLDHVAVILRDKRIVRAKSRSGIRIP